jgi:hypothetical protein
MTLKHVALGSAAVVLAVVLFAGGRDTGTNRDTGTSRPPAPGFWQLIESTRQAAGNDTGRQSKLLEERLSRLPAPSIVEFQHTHHRLDQHA